MALVIPSGSRTVMKMTTPPTGWTKDTTYDNYALRVTTGSVVNRTTGESFSTVFKNYNSISVPGPITYSAVNSTTIDNASLVSHRHLGINHPGATSTRRGGGSEDAVGAAAGPPITYTPAGSGSGHTHPIGTVAVTGTINQGGVNSEINLNIKYVDTIIAVRS
jgi:hypothetical protein